MTARNKLFLSAAFLPLVALSNEARAQQTEIDDAPAYQPTDGNGVDLRTGEATAPSPALSIGGDLGLSHIRLRTGNGWRHNFMLSLYEASDGNSVTINMGTRGRTFSKVNGAWVDDQGRGGTLSHSGSTWTFTDRNGTIYTFSESLVDNGESYYGAVSAVGTKIVAPNGYTVDLTYRGDTYQFDGNTIHTVRLQSVTNNASYQLKFDYAVDSPTSSTSDDWYRIARVTAVNNAVEYCDPAADSCSLTGDWPYLDYQVAASGSDTLESVVDMLGRETRFRIDSSERISGFKRPSETDDGVTYTYDAEGRAYTITNQDGYEQTYQWVNFNPPSGGEPQDWRISTDSLGRQQIVFFDADTGVVDRIQDPLYRNTLFEYDSFSRRTAVVAPEGNRTEIDYDARGNVTETRAISKDGSATITASATFSASCSNPVTCNKPTAITDARGNTTDFVYNATHGGVTRITRPADDDGDRPTQIVYYIAKTAKRRDAAGVLEDQPTSMTLYSHARLCPDQPVCVGAPQARLASVRYDSDNLLITKSGMRNGSNTISQYSLFTYDDLGNVLTVNGPRAGSADMVRYFYDSAGQRLGMIAPDPDGSGGNTRIASRVQYNDDGQVILSESGTTGGIDLAALNAMTVEARSLTSYDAVGRVANQASVDPNASNPFGNIAQYSVVQQGYDLAGRATCQTVRMNAPTTGTTLPDACILMTDGAFGSDRIARRYYDEADQVLQVRSAVGTALEQITAEFSYNDNGTLAWVEDAEDNRTSYVYDGFDRTLRVEYPDETTPNTSDPTNFESVTYDAAGNILTHRTRRGETLQYVYDNLGRVTNKLVPNRSGLSSIYTRDVFYGYDLTGAMLYARFDSATGDGITFAYDGLGRLTSQSSTMNGYTRAIGHAYDADGDYTQLTYPDGFAVDYAHDTLGRQTQLNTGGVTMAQWNFDSMGRLTAVDHYPSGTNTSSQAFGYDEANRLTDLDIVGSSSAANQSNFAYNPAGQVESESDTSSAFQYLGTPDFSNAYVPDGLNQYDSVGGATYGYDANGNLTSADGSIYVYDVENRLVEAVVGSNTIKLQYDPLGRLYQQRIENSSTITARRFVYDRDAIIAEYNGGTTMLARYVHGPSAGDDPMIAYDGASTAITDAQFLLRDRLGSIVGATDYQGALLYDNAYDEYGINAAGNDGRFRYTGQAWLPELGLYYYKARMYSPTIGRFMQTDPIGYNDGMNMYAYVGGDPVNWVDPTGAVKICWNMVSYNAGLANGEWEPTDDPEYEYYVECVGENDAATGFSGASFSSASSLFSSAGALGLCELLPLSEEDQALVAEIRASSEYQNSLIVGHIKTMGLGVETDFFVFRDGDGYSTSEMRTGLEGSMPDFQLRRRGQIMRNGSNPVAYVHLHTSGGSFPSDFDITIMNNLNRVDPNAEIFIIEGRGSFSAGRLGRGCR